MNRIESEKSWLERLVRRLYVDILPTTGLLVGMALVMAWLDR